MTFYELKTINPYFQDVYEGKKKFVLRLNDRKFKVGDILKLKEYIPERQEYTGDFIVKVVEYILPLEKLITVNTSDFWSINEISKHGIVILGLK
jgi:hypothetical protein